ncbi:MAG: hypothetical protein R3Y10_00175 [Ferrimonas sp.]
MAARVILLHGLYMNRLAMWPLANKLEQLGWAPLCLSYSSTRIDSAALFQQLDAEIDPNQPCYLIGHSLGGVMLSHYAHQTSFHPNSRLVTLGSPLRSSVIAKQLQQWGLGGLLGNARQYGLTENGFEQWHSDIALGSLAGNCDFGLGRITGLLSGSSDGTVTQAETELIGMQDHIILPVSHTGMLLSDAVAKQCDHFLHYGQFTHQDPL